jgi:hypothetical protein
MDGSMRIQHELQQNVGYTSHNNSNNLINREGRHEWGDEICDMEMCVDII